MQQVVSRDQWCRRTVVWVVVLGAYWECSGSESGESVHQSKRREMALLCTVDSAVTIWLGSATTVQ